MNLLTKFDQIEIQAENRISEDDKTFCENLQSQWGAFLLFANQYIQFNQDHSLQNEFYNTKENLRVMNTTIKNQREHFINKIISHFKTQYRVSLDSNDIKEKYKGTTSLHYSQILEEIFEQLGGYSFIEKAVAEIKEKVKGQVGRRSNLTLKGKKISIGNYVWWNSYSDEYRLSYSESAVKIMFVALSHFVSGSTQMLDTLESFYRELDSNQHQSTKFDKKHVHHDRVLSVKVFKNHKIEIECENHDLALEFARDYLGYSPSN